MFAALDTLRKKKKPENSKSKGSSKPQAEETPVVWTPAPLTVKSWADVDDDDDYFATAAPPPLAAWANTETQESKETPTPFDEETESEDDGLDDGDDDIDNEPENEPEVSAVESVIKPPPAVKKEAERQLSKKELKKKELEELEAVLAEFGIANKDGSVDDSQEKNQEQDSLENAPAPIESKTSKKKKKKEKASKETKDPQEQSSNVTEEGNPDDPTITEPSEDAPALDVKERLKKMASMKKKKSSKEMDAAATRATAEAAARSAKLAAAKKKEKNHYNQQPLR